MFLSILKGRLLAQLDYLSAIISYLLEKNAIIRLLIETNWLKLVEKHADILLDCLAVIG